MEMNNLAEKSSSKTCYVAYKDLIPCKNAFVDTRSPGSDKKENFTIIGPGVSENPNQHVHVPIAHGFNIGGARQPSGCLNSQHSHETAEVFIVQDGRWKFKWGVDGNEGDVVLEKGDTISIPIHMFRGFENITEGGGSHFLFAVLGGDDPGFVTWAPSVFELAKKYGLVLLKGGRLIDTTVGEKVPPQAELEQPLPPERLAKLASPSAKRMASCVVRYSSLTANAASPFAGKGIEECPIITPVATKDNFLQGPIVGWWPHGFNLRLIKMAENKSTPAFQRLEEEVLLMHHGNLEVECDNGKKITMASGDTLTIAIGEARRFIAGKGGASFFVVRGGNNPAAPVFM